MASLARTAPQLRRGDWSVDIGETNDIPQVYYFFKGSSPWPELTTPLSSLADLAAALSNPGHPQSIFEAEYREDPQIQVPGQDAYPVGADKHPRYEIRYVGDRSVPMLIVPDESFQDFLDITIAARDFDFVTAPGNHWDSTRSPSMAQYGFYPGLRTPSDPRAVPGF